MLEPRFWEEYSRLRALVNGALLEKLPHGDGLGSCVFEAIQHAMNGGKRIRPILVCVSAELVGGRAEAVLEPACAIEMMQTASLILDDLPCMDDARLRRGVEATHILYGEATAILASSSLMIHGMALLRKAASQAAEAIGTELIAGQSADLELRSRPVDLETLERIYDAKTGALLALSAGLGARLSGASERDIAALDRYARDVGLAKQIVDDILDFTASSTDTGKDVRRDVDRPTYVSFLGLDGAYRRARELLDRARRQLDVFHGRAWFLRQMAQYVETVHGPVPSQQARFRVSA